MENHHYSSRYLDQTTCSILVMYLFSDISYNRFHSISVPTTFPFSKCQQFNFRILSRLYTYSDNTLLLWTRVALAAAGYRPSWWAAHWGQVYDDGGHKAQEKYGPVHHDVLGQSWRVLCDHSHTGGRYWMHVFIQMRFLLPRQKKRSSWESFACIPNFSEPGLFVSIFTQCFSFLQMLILFKP